MSMQNVVERALILSGGRPLAFEDLGEAGKKSLPAAETFSADNGMLALEALVMNHIRRALEITGGRIEGAGGAAKLLEINPSTLRTKMRKLNIPFGKKRLSGTGAHRS